MSPGNAQSILLYMRQYIPDIHLCNYNCSPIGIPMGLQL